MSSPTSDTTRSRIARRVRWLYAIHVVLFFFCFLWGPLDSRTLNDATRLGFFLGETGLLAMLAAFVPASRKTRWISAIAACVWPFALIDPLLAHEGGAAALLILPVFAVVLGGAIAMRFKGHGLFHYALDQPLPANEPLQATIRQLLIGTSAVAAVAASAFGLRGLFERNETLTILAYLILFPVNPFLALWAALGPGDPRVRSILILVVAVSMGALAELDSMSGRELWWFYPCAFSMQAAVMLETLWVVRSCRYRLGPTPEAASLFDSSVTLVDPLSAPWARAWTFLQPKLSIFRCLPWPLWLLLGLFIGIDNHLAWHVFEYDGDWAFNSFVVLPIAQAGVLAIVCVLANLRWVYRIALAGAGMMALLRLVHRTLGDLYVVPFIVIAAAMVFVVMFVTCTVIRQRGFSLQRFGPNNSLPPREPFRFSIAQIIVLTSLVALLFATMHWVEQIDEPNVLLMVTILSLNFLPGALLALWAALDPSHLIVRCAIALLLGTAPAILPDLYLDLSNEPWGLWIWPFMTGLNTSLILASLLVVRSCDYRLVRWSPVDPASAPGVGSFASHDQERA